MTTALSPDFTTSMTPPAETPTTGRRNPWALWGAAAGVFGAVATVVPARVNLQKSNAYTTASVVAKLHRWPYQLSVVTGFAAVACLLVAAAALVYAAFREGLVPRWVGVASAAFVLIALLPLIATGLPGMPGVIGPFWLAAVSVGLARSRRFA